MDNLYAGISIGLALGLPLVGLGFMLHGFNLITINKNYYTIKNKKEDDK